ncbi:MAG: NAD(P)-dependent oxidoreductase, partial [Bacillota bacterium]|nr:NAD(P)-dependent oxidoreductase [Bacillota bacterium]
MKPKVYVTRPLPIEAVALLKEKCDVEMEESLEPISKKDLINKLKDKDAVLVSRTKIDEEICKAIKGKCKILANYGVGYDNIDVAAATKNNIFVTYNPNAVTSATANLTMGLILASTRRIVESDKSVRNGFKKWGPLNFLGTNLENKYIGIIGGGRVGTAVAKRAISFDMKVLYTSRRRKKDFENLGASYLDKEELLKKSD